MDNEYIPQWAVDQAAEGRYFMRDPGVRRTVIAYGTGKGQEEVKQFYPYMNRDPQVVSQLAANALEHEYSYNYSQVDDKEEYKRLYISGYLKGYFDEVGEQDKKAGITTPPQTWAMPTTTTDTISIDGATFKVRNIERSTDKIRYFLEINHPGVTDGVETITLAHPISNSSSGTPIQANAGSDTVSSSQQSQPIERFRFSSAYKTYGSSSQSQSKTSSSSDAEKKKGFSLEKGSQFNVEK